jgi:carbon monoxide dehydrogenase subunit G
MELKNDVVVNSSIQDVWEAFNDVERVAPCLPGAQLQEIEGDEMRGIVKVKVGPITAQYKGQAKFIEQNKDAWKIVIEGKGRDARGAGDASALITAQLTEIDAGSTKLDVTTDLALTGKVASFGGRSGVMEDVSSKLMGQFADNFEKMMEAAKTAPAAPAAEAADAGEQPKIRKIEMPEPEAVDLLEHAGGPVMKALAPIAITILVIWLLRRIFGGNRD